MRLSLVAWIFVVFLAPRAGAEEPPRPAWQARIAEAVKSPDAWNARAAEIRRHILVAAGLWPPFERTPLKPTIFGRLERDGYSVEKVHFETWPGFYLTGNLYRPLGKTGPFPGVVSPHGHWKEGRFEDGPLGSVPGRAITLARFGFVVFSYDMVGFGDLKQAPHDFGDPLWGISLCGLQLWDSLRAVDFLASLPDVDPKRIGCTGASGGGTQTFLLTAVDDRIACAAPVNMVAAEFQGGCLCENAPLLRIDLNNVEIAACAAPRPLLLVCATGDWTKDTPTVAAPEIQKIYKLLGVEEKFRVVQFNAEHNYNKDSREAVYAWFVYWLKPPGWETALSATAGGAGLPSRPDAPTVGAAVAPEGRASVPARTTDPGGRGLQPPIPADDRGPKAAPTRIPEPPFQVEKREDLAVWGPDHPLPAGAVDAAGLKKEMKEAIRAQLEAMRPRDAATLVRFRSILLPALRHVTCANWPSDSEASDRIFSLLFKAAEFNPFRTDPIPGPKVGTSLGIADTLLAVNPGFDVGVPHEERRATFITVESPLDKQQAHPLMTSLRPRDTLLAMLQLTLKDVDNAGLGCPSGDNTRKFASTYLRTGTAARAQHLLSVLAGFLAADSPCANLQAGQLQFVGAGETGIPTLLACGLLPDKVRVQQIIVDMCGIDDTDEKSWTGDRFHPGILRIGGLRAAGCLIAAKGGKLVLHNTQGKFDATWVRDAFKAAGREGDLVVDEKAWTVDQIVEALK